MDIFSLDAPIKEEFRFADFRTLHSDGISNPSRDLVDTVDAMSIVQSWMSDYRRENGFTELLFLNKFAINSSIDSIAQNIRYALDIDLDWFLKFETSKKLPNS